MFLPTKNTQRQVGQVCWARYFPWAPSKCHFLTFVIGKKTLTDTNFLDLFLDTESRESFLRFLGRGLRAEKMGIEGRTIQIRKHRTLGCWVLDVNKGWDFTKKRSDLVVLRLILQNEVVLRFNRGTFNTVPVGWKDPRRSGAPRWWWWLSQLLDIQFSACGAQGLAGFAPGGHRPSGLFVGCDFAWRLLVSPNIFPLSHWSNLF